MILWQANLGRGASADEFAANLGRVLRAGGKRAVFAFQEIDEADTPEEMDTLHFALRKTHKIAGGHTSVPICVPNHLALIESVQSLGCIGLAKFTPHRPINEALVGIGPNLEVAVLNWHVPIDRPETKGRRTQVRRNARARAKRYEHGAWVSDTNTHRGWPEIVPDERTVTDAGIDKAKAWAGEGRHVVVSDRRTVDLTIDGHDAHGARIRWERS